jgi:cytochrome P450
MTDARLDAEKSNEWDPVTAWKPLVDADESSSTEIYAQQRRTCPLSFHTTEQSERTWHAFSSSDVAKILMDTEVFSSAGAQFGKPMIPIELDPPTHTIFRRLLSNMMAPRRMLKYESSIRAYVLTELEPLIAAGGGDFVPLTYRLPVQAFCLLVGETDDRAYKLLEENLRNAPSLERGDKDAVAQRAAAVVPLAEYCRERLRSRRGNPRDDLASDIANGQINGSLIEEDDATQILTLIYMAGHDTTAMGLQGAVSVLAKHADAQGALRSNPDLIPQAIEECLRIETPLHKLPRRCVREITISGRAILPGDLVFPVFGAANVDPEAFEAPGHFDINRKPNHFSFGRGIHTCPGSPLARLEIKVLLQELLARTTRFALGTGASRDPWPRNAYASLPIVLHT